MWLTQKNGAKLSNLMHKKKEMDGTTGHKKNLRSSAR